MPGTPDPVGLCRHCRHVQRVPSRRGQVFYLCLRSKTDSRFPKYPPLPVRQCPGFEPETDQQDGE